jgi:hypothetical protein
VFVLGEKSLITLTAELLRDFEGHHHVLHEKVGHAQHQAGASPGAAFTTLYFIQILLDCFVPGRPFQLSLIFEYKAESLP